jgi:hypothetical protein
MQKIQFVCSLEQFEKIHLSVDRTRTTSKTVTIDRQALVNLLIDHSRLLKLHQIES